MLLYHMNHVNIALDIWTIFWHLFETQNLKTRAVNISNNLVKINSSQKNKQNGNNGHIKFLDLINKIKNSEHKFYIYQKSSIIQLTILISSTTANIKLPFSILLSLANTIEYRIL